MSVTPRTSSTTTSLAFRSRHSAAARWARDAGAGAVDWVIRAVGSDANVVAEPEANVPRRVARTRLLCALVRGAPRRPSIMRVRRGRYPTFILRKAGPERVLLRAG